MKRINVSLLAASLLLINLWGIASGKLVNSLEESASLLESPELTGLESAGHKVQRRGLLGHGGLLGVTGILNIDNVLKLKFEAVLGLDNGLFGFLLGLSLGALLALVVAQGITLLALVGVLLLSQFGLQNNIQNCGQVVEEESFDIRKFEKLDLGNLEKAELRESQKFVAEGVSGGTNANYGYGGANTNAKTNAKETKKNVDALQALNDLDL